MSSIAPASSTEFLWRFTLEALKSVSLEEGLSFALRRAWGLKLLYVSEVSELVFAEEI